MPRAHAYNTGRRSDGVGDGGERGSDREAAGRGRYRCTFYTHSPGPALDESFSYLFLPTRSHMAAPDDSTPSFKSVILELLSLSDHTPTPTTTTPWRLSYEHGMPVCTRSDCSCTYDDIRGGARSRSEVWTRRAVFSNLKLLSGEI